MEFSVRVVVSMICRGCHLQLALPKFEPTFRKVSTVWTPLGQLISSCWEALVCFVLGFACSFFMLLRPIEHLHCRWYNVEWRSRNHRGNWLPQNWLSLVYHTWLLFLVSHKKRKTGTSQVGAISKPQTNSKGDTLERKKSRKSCTVPKKSKGDPSIRFCRLRLKSTKPKGGPFGTT